MVANRFGGIRKLPNEFLQAPQRTDRCAFECAGEFLHINKFCSLTPRKDGFHPTKGWEKVEKVETSEEYTK